MFEYKKRVQFKFLADIKLACTHWRQLSYTNFKARTEWLLCKHVIHWISHILIKYDSIKSIYQLYIWITENSIWWIYYSTEFSLYQWWGSYNCLPFHGEQCCSQRLVWKEGETVIGVEIISLIPLEREQNVNGVLFVTYLPFKFSAIWQI